MPAATIVGLTRNHTYPLRRDVKTSNILLTRDGGAKVADVGLATMTDGFSSAHPATGTFLYAAPEVLMGRPSTAKVTMYPILRQGSRTTPFPALQTDYIHSP